MTASPAFTEYTVLTTSPHIKPHTRRHYLPRHNSGATVARQHTAHFPAQPVGGGRALAELPFRSNQQCLCRPVQVRLRGALSRPLPRPPALLGHRLHAPAPVMGAFYHKDSCRESDFETRIFEAPDG